MASMPPEAGPSAAAIFRGFRATGLNPKPEALQGLGFWISGLGLELGAYSGSQYTSEAINSQHP